jgi:uncharacterized membrane protein YfcA
MRHWLTTIGILLLSLAASFYVVLNSVFSDVSGPAERAWSFVIVGVAYLILGVIAGWLEPARRTRFEWILATPAVLILILYALSEAESAALDLGFAIMVMIASWVGAYFGARLQANMKKRAKISRGINARRR